MAGRKTNVVLNRTLTAFFEHLSDIVISASVKINTDDNLKAIGFDFDVPNGDFFEALKPYRK